MSFRTATAGVSALVVAIAVLVLPGATALAHGAVPSAPFGDAPAGAEPAGTEPAGTEPVGTDTTDPESSAEDATRPPAWLLWVALGVGVAVVAVYAIRSRRGSGEP